MSGTLQTTVALSYAIATLNEDKAETTTALTVKRPKTRQVKQLVALLGPSLVKVLLADQPGGPGLRSADKLDLSAIDVDLLAGLLSADNLDALLAIVADLAGIKPAEADELDPVDLMSVLAAIAGFFPGLAGMIASLSSPRT